MTWSTNGVDGNYTILSAQLQHPQPFGEIADHAEDATEYFGMKNNVCVYRAFGTQRFWSLAYLSQTATRCYDLLAAFRPYRDTRCI